VKSRKIIFPAIGGKALGSIVPATDINAAFDLNDDFAPRKNKIVKPIFPELLK